MVSLSSDSRHSGGYFFHDNNSIQDQDADELVPSSSPLSASCMDHPYRKINTVWAIALEIVAFVGLEVCVFVLPSLCNKGSADSLLIYIYSSVWFLVLILDRYYRYQHNKSRMAGYLEFYRRSRNIRRFPLLINSIGSTILLIVIKVMETKCDSGNGNDSCGKVHKSVVLQIVISLDVAFSLICLVLYLVKTIQFNTSNSSPDATHDELSSSFMQSSVSTEIGFRDENYSEQVLEKQADMIRYLKQHNAQLSKRILALTAQNSAHLET